MKANPDDPRGTIHQTFDTIPAQRYEVSFFLTGPGLQFANPRVVDVWIDPATQLSFSAPAGPIASMAWQKKAFEFAAAGPQSTLTFRAGSTSAGNGQYWGPVVDGVAVRAVPEPSALVLAAFAAISVTRGIVRRAPSPAGKR